MDTASSRRERYPQCRSQSRDSNRAQAPIRLWSPTSECDWLCLLGEIRGIHISSFQTGNNTDISSLRRLPAPAEVTRGHAVVGQQDSISLRTSDSAVHGRQGPDQPPPQLQVVIAYLRVSDSTSVQEWVTPQSGTQLVPGRRDAASPVPSLCGGPASTASHTVTSTTDTQVNMASGDPVSPSRRRYEFLGGLFEGGRI